MGPRPLLMRYLARYSPEQARRHEVQPGITGWAQVKHRYDSNIDDVKTKVLFDLWYFENMSLSLDIIIMLRTVWVVITGHGAQ